MSHSIHKNQLKMNLFSKFKKQNFKTSISKHLHNPDEILEATLKARSMREKKSDKFLSLSKLKTSFLCYNLDRVFPNHKLYPVCIYKTHKS